MEMKAEMKGYKFSAHFSLLLRTDSSRNVGQELCSMGCSKHCAVPSGFQLHSRHTCWNIISCLPGEWEFRAADSCWDSTAEVIWKGFFSAAPFQWPAFDCGAALGFCLFCCADPKEFFAIQRSWEKFNWSKDQMEASPVALGVPQDWQLPTIMYHCFGTLME